ncbi:MAG: ABC transporter permease [Terriglobales bacterium]
MKFTLMSACLDPLKLIYVAMIGFVMPIGMKIAFMLHNASDSQTFEMLTGKVGVAFVLMVLCLGLAGNSSTQSGRGGENLPLIFTRPISRAEYVMSKWLVITAIGGAFAALQNLIVAAIGFCFGETITLQALLSMVVERILDAGVISAAMILTMLARHPMFQITAILSFYIWLAGQTLPPVSVSTGAGIQDLSIEATKYMCSMSQYIAQAVLPTVNVYDLLNSAHFTLSPLIAYVSALSFYLVCAVAVTNRREFFYGTN